MDVNVTRVIQFYMFCVCKGVKLLCVKLNAFKTVDLAAALVLATVFTITMRRRGGVSGSSGSIPCPDVWPRIPL